MNIIMFSMVNVLFIMKQNVIMNPNSYIKQQERAIKRKLELIEYKGGECERCHYRHNLSALEFHHIKPNEKVFQLDSRHLSNMNIEKLKNEVDKCVLLCANCHREIHYPEYNEDNIPSLLETYSTSSVSTLRSKRKQTACPVCGALFNSVRGKKFCSVKCREKYEGKDRYPNKEEVISKYSELHSWEKVAKYYGLTRRIIQGIRAK